MRIAINSVGVYERKGFARNFCLAKGLARLGNEVTFLTCSQKCRTHREYRDGVEIIAFPDFLNYRLKKGGLGILDTLMRIWFLLKRDFDIIHVDVGFRPAGGVPGHLYSKIKGVPYVCDWWDWIGKGGSLDERSLVYRMTLGASDNVFEVADKKIADGIITISRCLQKRAIDNGIPKEKTVVIHGGADLDGVEYQNKRTFRAQFGFDPNSVILGFAGMGPHEYVDLLPFLEALPELRSNHKKFAWFSTGGKLPQQVRDRYGVGDEYYEFGWTSSDDYKKLLGSADILLLLLRDDVGNLARWPNKMGDYIAAGRPVLTTNIGEISYFAKQYPDGVYIVDWDRTSVVDGVKSLIEDPERMEEMGRANFEVAKNDYSWDAKAREFDKFYRRVIDEYSG